MSLTQTEQKILSANTAVETLIEKGFIFSGMKIGLGTGSTALPAVKRLSEFIKDGTLKDLAKKSFAYTVSDSPVKLQDADAASGHYDQGI